MRLPPGWTRAAVAALLVLATAALYWQVGHHPFIDFDDDLYVVENAFVRRGLTLEGLAWAFRTTSVQNWHPVTWLSHMADVSIFGLDPGRHHLVNVLLHAANAVLLFGLLASATGATWRSGLVAALFAVHPLHVESVAWIAERKDLLSTLFGLGAATAYVGWARRGGSLRRAAVTVLFALSLMSKPMLVTLPFALILLDAWPLDRLRSARGGPVTALARLLLEKSDLMILAAISSVVTYTAQRSGGAVVAVDVLPPAARLANAITACAGYLRQALWPSGLAIYYPHVSPSPWAVLGAASLLAIVTAAAIWQARPRPFLLVGWLWFLGTLVPVLGLVQVGGQAMADRYTYVPLIGLSIMAAWGLGDLASRTPATRWVISAGSLMAAMLLLVASSRQLAYWRSSESLFRHAIAATPGNWMAHTNLGKGLLREGRVEEAVAQFAEALRLRPASALTLTNLGAALGRAGRHADAVALLEQAVRADGAYDAAWYNLGVARLQRGDPAAAAGALSEAVRLARENHWAHYFLGVALLRAGTLDGAERALRDATTLRPDSVEAVSALGVALAQQGRIAEAIEQFRRAAGMAPGDPEVQANLENALREVERR